MRQPAQERGRRRRDALLDAGAQLLADGGFAKVSHRAVAERAGLPLAATTYYFRSRDELIAAAFERMVDRDIAATRARFTERIGRSAAARAPDSAELLARAAAEAFATALLPHDESERRRHLALWELYLQAGRDPALRPLARAWTDRCRELTRELLRIAGYPATEASVGLLGAAADGLAIEAVVEDRPNAVRSMVETMSRALDQIRTTEGA
jgi:TetR/AcrR family transcriptional regulator, regulator of biofilm formation and stress response